MDCNLARLPWIDYSAPTTVASMGTKLASKWARVFSTPNHESSAKAHSKHRATELTVAAVMSWLSALCSLGSGRIATRLLNKVRCISVQMSPFEMR